MAVIIAGQVGEQQLQDGSIGANARLGRLAEVIVSENQGRFYELARLNKLFKGGISALTALGATHSVNTLGATCTPIVGLRNPSSSKVNGVVLQATLIQIMTALAATGGGPCVWASAIGQSALTLGGSGWNVGTLVKGGSTCQDMSGIALTGLVGNLTVMFGSALGGGSGENASFTATAAGMQTQIAGLCENLDGSLVVPPGGVIALLTTTTSVAHSATSSILWDEVPA